MSESKRLVHHERQVEVDQTVQLEPKDSVEHARPVEQARPPDNQQEEEPFLPMVERHGLGQPIEIEQTAKSHQLMVGLRPSMHILPMGLNLISEKGPWS